MILSPILGVGISTNGERAVMKFSIGTPGTVVGLRTVLLVGRDSNGNPVLLHLQAGDTWL